VVQGRSKSVILALLMNVSLLLASIPILAIISQTALGEPRPTATAIPYDEVMQTTHKMTTAEMTTLRESNGIRDPSKSYNHLVNGHGTGLAPPTESEWEEMVGKVNIVDPVGLASGSASLRSSFDLSSSSAFPIVGDQGSQGSCAAWAATYYAYGYMEAADNGWNDAHEGNPIHLLSPAWTYNMVNGGVDGGSWSTENMRVICDWGVPTMREMPYDQNYYTWWGPPAAFREAPLHRAYDCYSLSYGGQATVDAVRTLVSGGTPVTFAIDSSELGPAFYDGNYVVSSAEYASSTTNHAQTIVGYNDGISDDGDVGAFRIVNSWGASWGDHGYYWLTYNAFKEIGFQLDLAYLVDRHGYSPSMLAVWHFTDGWPSSRDALIEVGIGAPSWPATYKIPYFVGDSTNSLPLYMCLDISEFMSTYMGGTRSFYLSCGPATWDGKISSFKIELYENGYSPGVASQVSAQSPNVPKATPGDVTNVLLYYSPVPADEALDTIGRTYVSSGFATWVGVDHHANGSAESMQSGDLPDLTSSVLQTTVEGSGQIWFDWKVSSENGFDFLTFKIDGRPLNAISGEVNWEKQHFSFDGGTHTLEWVYQKDNYVGIGEDCGWIDNVVIDALPPVTTLHLNGDEGSYGWYDSAVSVTLTAADPDTGINWTKYSVDGGPLCMYSNPFSITTNGTHFLTFYSQDRAGHTEGTQSIWVYIDQEMPALDFNDRNGTIFNTTSPDVVWSCSDDVSGLDLIFTNLDGSGFTIQSSMTTSLHLANMSQGTHSLLVIAEDSAGLMTERTLSFVVDSIRPETGANLSGTIDGEGVVARANANTRWFTSNVTVTLESSDQTSGVKRTLYCLDGGDWNSYASPLDITAEGVHSLLFYSEDLAGNAETPNAASISIDKTPPSLSFVQRERFVLTVNSTAVSWVSSDELSGIDHFEVSVDGGAFSSNGNTTNVNILGLENGEHKIIVRAVDKAGNLVERELSFSVEIKEPARTNNVMERLLLVSMSAGLVGALVIGFFFGRRRRDHMNKPGI
jgi:C1A family cysteine protease